MIFKNTEFSGHIRLTLLAVVVGLGAGLASVAFKAMIQFFQSQFWRAPTIIQAASSQGWYLTILAPAAGGLILGSLIYYGAREAKGHGVPEIMEAQIFHGGRIRKQVVAVKAIASSICIGSGGSIGREDVAEIAVIRDEKFFGVIKRKDVIEAYNHEITKKEAASGLIQKLKFAHLTKTIDIGKGYTIMEIDAPPSFCNKTLKELNLKAIYRIDVLLIKRKYPPQTITLPSADEVIRKGDLLIIAGLAENIKKIGENTE